MLGKNFSLLFYLKKPKNYLRGDVPIYMRITVNGQVKELTTSRKCVPGEAVQSKRKPSANPCLLLDFLPVLGQQFCHVACSVKVHAF